MKNGFFLLLILSFTLTSFAHAGDCEDLIIQKKIFLEAAIDTAFYKTTKTEPEKLNFYKKFKKNLMRDAILRKCMQVGCTENEIAKLVADSIQRSFFTRNARNLTIVGLAMLSTAYISTRVSMHFNDKMEFTSTFLPSVFSQFAVLMAAIYSPYANAVTGKLQKTASKVDKAVRKNLDFEDQSDQSTGTYTYREQHAIDRIYMFRNIIWLNFTEARRDLDQRNIDGVAYKVADAVLIGYKNYQDVHPENDEILSAVQASFLQDGILGLPLIYDKAYAILKEWNPAFKKGEAKVYAERALSAWLGLNFFQK